MKVVVYTPGFNDKLRDVLLEFAAGIPGAAVMDIDEFSPETAGDVGVIFGWYKLAYHPTMGKKAIIEHYMAKGRRHLVVVESAFVRRGDYYQVGWDGFAGRADFRAAGVPIDRFSALEVPVRPWIERPGPVVVIGQLLRDTQVQDYDHAKWCRDTVKACQQWSREVLFRPHPRCQDASVYGVDECEHDTGPLEKTLARARQVVIFNSTTGVDAVLAGVPIVAADKAGAFSAPVSGHDIMQKLCMPDRYPWLAKLGYSQWTPDEMRKGIVWRHLTR